ncbi:MAG: acyl-CoA synthetase [Ilumatobacteraceae bacterium]
MAGAPTAEFTVGEVHEAIAATRPERECIVFRDRRLTWAEVTDRTRRLANYLNGRGLGCHVERSAGLEGHESGQDHLGIYLYNGNEYLEAMLGAFKGRVAPFNVNYRYVAEELTYLLADARPSGLVYHSRFAPMLAAIVGDLPGIEVLLQVADETDHPLLPGAVWYEDALASASPEPPPPASPDDLYILYTGGTTGMPKGVLWRQADALTECMGGARDAVRVDDFVAAATGRRALLAPPFMHGAGHWMSFGTWNTGGTVFVQDDPGHLDPADILELVERERIEFLLIVGDSFARPLLDELDRKAYDLSSLAVVLSGGATLSAHYKDALLQHLPTAIVIDGLGSSEAGGQLAHVSTGGCASTGTFALTEGNHVLSDDLSRELSPGDPEIGWLAKSGRLALGYLGDRAKTQRTYPVVNGRRYVVPGDRARLTADNMVQVLGREAATINTGGEKVFAEEVESALRQHPDVYDCIVTGRPSERWGQEVVAVVQLREGSPATSADVLNEAARHIARFKVPKLVVFVDRVVRSPSGKADYRWARAVSAEA